MDNGTTFEWKNCADENAFIIFSYVLFSVIFFPTIFGNILIIVSICKFRHLRSNMHILIGNLAVSDLIIAVSIILQVVGNFREELVTNKYFCLGQNAVFVISLGTSSYNMLTISIERFLAVKFPLKHRIMFTRRTSYILIIVCWSYHSLFASLPLLGWNNFHDDVLVCDTDLVWTREYDIILFAGLLIVVIVNGLLCGYMMKIIVEKGKIVRYNSSDSFKNQRILGNFKRTKMTLIIFGVFALSWTPYLIVSLILSFENKPAIRCSRQWCICLGIINSATNWIIYGLANRSFREAFKAVLKGRRLVHFRGSLSNL
ncbi:octopamine receptor-like [Ruditapes philippinarum]|uniref:octopamine receptor-like n=1 Tax=Ruditapes philippinarum TaxID=129788 RepID=UPI00295BED0C|nr:octopamine receptor-like [Ruditapes philippinarum]